MKEALMERNVSQVAKIIECLEMVEFRVSFTLKVD